MTLTLELNPETETWLQAEAARMGVDPGEYALRLLENKRCAHPQWKSLHAEERRSRLQDIRGKYRNVGFTTEDLHRERRADLVREEQQLQEHFGGQKQ